MNKPEEKKSVEEKEEKKGFMGDEDVLTEEEEADLKEKLKYYGYI